MEITYLGHSAFRLRGKEVTVLTDPFPPDLGLSMGKARADIVTVSHDSPNHSFVSGVDGTPRLVRGPGEYEIADVLIAGLATAQQPGGGPTNTAYVLRFDDLSVCHLGDLRSKLSDAQIEQIGSIDVLLVPVGGGSVLEPAKAAEVVTALEPSLVIPMHYKIEGARVDGFAPVEHFCREMGVKEVVPETRINVTKSSLPSEVRVVVLQHRSI